MMRRRLPAGLLLALIALLVLLPPALAEEESKERLVAETFSGLELRGIGPALMSGRIADIAVHPQDRSTWYVAVGSGGVWKTTNAGTTWQSIFDGQGSYSIGCITLDPQRPDTVWVGTGENVGGRHVGYGDGIYRSRDGGKSWEKMGLEDSEHIGNILVHPQDSDVIWVAAQGPLWSAGGERGLFKSSDGGKSWNKLLGDDEYTGVNEVHMDPRNPDVLFAATHQRFRSVAALVNGGPGSGIHKSTDGGETWRELSSGLPQEDMGKIGLAISPIKPDVMYATIELSLREGGFFRSTDGGETWEQRSDYLSGATGPHYYQEIFADPHRFDHVYQMDANLHHTEDGGRTFVPVNEQHKHGDNHAMAFDPVDPDYLLLGSDGGLYESWDRAQSWKYVANLPVTQFYKVAVDNDTPFYNLYGGTQDNNTQGGPSRTLNVHGIRNSDWFITLFGDGHQPAVDPENPDIVYSEWQQGNLVRYDRSTGEIVYIKPQPEPGEPAERWNWDSPILISPHNPARLYFASQRVWRSDNRGDSWRPISGDLSLGQDRLLMPMMGRVQSYNAAWDLWAMSTFANVTSLSESPLKEGLIYAGTDDGLVQVTEDGGQSWRRAGKLPGVPDGSFVNDIKADLHDENTVYVALDNHKQGDFRPFLLKSTDRGRSWKSIAGDLPERHLVWRMVQDFERPELLFAGTEFAIFFTVDGGSKWIRLTGGAPTISFRDLAIQQRESDLVAASFGRGFYILDDYSPLRQVSEDMLSEEAHLFPVKDALWYIERRTLGGGEKASQGHAFFTAPNPPYGAVFTYYLRDAIQSRQEQRREQEKELAKEGKDTPYPGWDALREEAREVPSAVRLTVRDAQGQVVRRIDGPNSAGFHRVAWDLHYPTLEAWSPPQGGEDDDGGPRGFIAPPGRYSAQLARLVDGQWQELGEAQSFQVRPLQDTVLPRQDPQQTSRFLRQLEKLQGKSSALQARMGETEQSLQALLQVLSRTPAEVEALETETRTMLDSLADLRERLSGDPRKNTIGEPTEASVSQRLFVASVGNIFSTYGPTPTHRRQVEIATSEIEALRVDLSEIISKYIGLTEQLEAAGVPWTPGREVPARP